MKKIFILMLVFMFCFINVVPSFASTSNLVDYSDKIKNAEHHLIVKKPTEDTYMLVVLKHSTSYTEEQLEGTEFIVRKEEDGKYHVRLLKGNTQYAFISQCYGLYEIKPTEWSYIGQDNSTGYSISNAWAGEFIESTVNVYDLDGNLVFPEATHLYQIIQKVTIPEVAKTQTTVVGVMKILALCGVGCLALLMVLPLFGKVLNRYR